MYKQFFGLFVLGLVSASIINPRQSSSHQLKHPLNLQVLYEQPEQIHLSYGADPTQMVVTWVTMNATKPSMVEYGVSSLTDVTYGNVTVFVDGGDRHRVLFIHRVILTGLTPGQSYVYHCGSDDGWSSLYLFTAMTDGTDWSPRFVVYGDMGNTNAQSLPRLQEEVQHGDYDVVLHVGDFAYDMDTDNAHVGDEFMRQIEPIAAYLPYMTCPGNHEEAYNFSNYDNRFTMISQNENRISNHYYSWNIGPIHIVSFSTEFFFYLNYGVDQLQYMYDWLVADLQEANTPENRALRPWIITMGHRPMYCSNNDTDDCTFTSSILRTGFYGMYPMEELFYENGVDLEFWAHEHSYERLWPIYNYTVYNGSYDEPYTNPKAPVHIITGSAGCDEDLTPFKNIDYPWSAFRAADYGYTRMNVYNSTHLYLEQVSDDQDGAVIDHMWLIKDTHGPEAWL